MSDLTYLDKGRVIKTSFRFIAECQAGAEYNKSQCLDQILGAKKIIYRFKKYSNLISFDQTLEEKISRTYDSIHI